MTFSLAPFKFYVTTNAERKLVFHVDGVRLWCWTCDARANSCWSGASGLTWWQIDTSLCVYYDGYQEKHETRVYRPLKCSTNGSHLSRILFSSTRFCRWPYWVNIYGISNSSLMSCWVFALQVIPGISFMRNQQETSFNRTRRCKIFQHKILVIKKMLSDFDGIHLSFVGRLNPPSKIWKREDMAAISRKLFNLFA